MNLQKKEDIQQERIWFIVSLTGTIVTIITSTILIIQFSRNYKDKSSFQHIIFLFSGIIMLFLGIYLNYIIIIYTNDNKDKYSNFIVIPKLLMGINIVFFIYVIYTLIKRFSFEQKLINCPIAIVGYGTFGKAKLEGDL